MSSKKILGIIFAILFLLAGFALGIWVAYKKEKQKLFDQAVPVQSALLYREKLAKGEWDEKTLILENLKIIAGKKTSQEVYGLPKVKSPHLNAIKRRAHQYLERGQDETAKSEIKRLLKKIYPDFSKPSPKTSLNKNNFEIISKAHADAPTCFGGLCYETHSFAGGGHSNALYVEESVGTTPAFISAVQEAVTDSLNTYQGVGLSARQVAVIVMNRFNDTVDVEADGGIESFRGASTCTVYVWGHGVENYNTRGAAYFKQMLAHEIFHCVQSLNFPRQMGGPSTEATDWWVEGTADYFSNVVYPATNAEYVYDADFDANAEHTPLYRMSYEANVFFQDFANQSSDAAILALIVSLPTSGSFAEQQNAIAALGSMPNIFHKFAEHYLDEKIRDSSGAMRSLTPDWGSTEEISEARTLSYSVEPFVIGRKKLHFNPRHQLFNITVNEEQPGKYSSQKQGEHTWAPLPARIGRSACHESEDSTYKLAQTKVAPSAETYSLEIQVSSAASSPAPDGVNTEARDSCLFGNWELDPASHAAALNSVMATIGGQTQSNISITSSHINATGCFMNDGRLAAQMNYSVSAQVNHSLFNYGVMMQLNTQTVGNYSAEAATLNFWNFTYLLYDGSMLFTGGEREEPKTFTAPIPKPVQLKYQCSGNNLQIQIPHTAGPWISLRRLR